MHPFQKAPQQTATKYRQELKRLLNRTKRFAALEKNERDDRRTKLVGEGRWKKGANETGHLQGCSSRSLGFLHVGLLNIRKGSQQMKRGVCCSCSCYRGH